MSVRTMLITESDVIRLKRLLNSTRTFLTKKHAHLRLLEEDLEHAEVVIPEAIPSDVITMNAQIRIHDLDVGRQTVYTLVFPRDADVAKNRISVFAPFGTALLGYHVGDLIECAAQGVTKRLRVKEIVSRPNVSGHSV